MSAITGILHINTDAMNLTDCHNLTKSLQHYPSDVIHTLKSRHIFLCCHNQWITPESLGETLPFYDDERQLAITADAIIDNREELLSLLQPGRELSKFMSDSQLILLAYAKWGEEVPKHLHGDFAFMIWDERERKLFGARDFSGARTLYYYNDKNRFVFSTTIEPLFTLPYIEKRLNEEWLAEFLAIPTMVEAVDMFSTVYKSVLQVPPSHSITIKNGKVNLFRYNAIDMKETVRLKSNEEYEEAFRHILQQAVRARIRTHGEVGSHLSGGLDSGSVVSFAAKELKARNKQLHTFSYIPEGSFKDWTPYYYEADESLAMKETVSYIGNIVDTYCSFDGRSPLSEVDDFLNLMEMPYKFFENTFWLKGINETAQQKGIKIMLNGARGNHSISWGSITLTHHYYATLFKKLKWIRLLHELDAYCIHFRTGKSVMLPFIAKHVVLQPFVKKENDDFPVFIHPAFAQKTNVYEKLQDYGFGKNGLIFSNLSEYRRNYYRLPYVWNKSGVASTKLSLRYGVWDRDPTNDVNVIRFCLAIPEEQYVTGGLERSLIRRAMKGYLPDKVRLNQRTRGIQGADAVHRMISGWRGFLNELHALTRDTKVNAFLNVNVIKESLSKLGTEPKNELVFSNEFKVLTRSLIVYRFMKSLG